MIKIEEMAMNAFPALSTVLHDSWILRFSEGYAKRGNSVSVIYPYQGDIIENIAYCETLYTKQKLPVVFKMTGHDAYKHIDKTLEDRGYAVEAKTTLMTMDLKAYSLENKFKPANVHISDKLTEMWFDGYMALLDLKARDQIILKKMLSSIILPTVYAFMIQDHKIVAVGMGVLENGHIGIYHLYVHKAYRRKGLGLALMGSLLKEAIAEGCTQSYLQVVADNENAIKLYIQMGYQYHYDYWYRVKQK